MINYYFPDCEGVQITGSKIDFSCLIGITLSAAKAIRGDSGYDRIEFESVDGRKFIMLHDYDRCASVTIESICGDINDLIGTPILLAEEVINTSSYKGTGFIDGKHETWTFYKLATIKGYIDIRWYGTSNGYYSERVDFIERSADDEVEDEHNN